MEILIFIAGIILLLGVLYLLIGPIRWRALTGSRYSIYDIIGIDIIVREKLPIYKSLLFLHETSVASRYGKEASKCLMGLGITSFFHKYNKYFDEDILQRTEILFVDSIESNKFGSCYGASLRLHNYAVMEEKILILINLREGKKNGLRAKGYTKLFLHEYLHAWLEKHVGDHDPFHKRKEWALLSRGL